MPVQKKLVNRHDGVAILRLNGLEVMEPRCVLSANPVLSEISGTVFHDLNNDGFQSASESGIGNVLITLSDQLNIPISVTLTDADGNYTFSRLATGAYSVVETQPNGWVDNDGLQASTENPASQYDILRQVKLVSDAHATDIDFAEYRTTSIAGSVYQSDLEGDCLQHVAENRLAESPVQLQDIDGEVVQTTSTDADGNYRFDRVAPGQYRVVHAASDHAIGKLDVTAESGRDYFAYDFCEVPAPDVSGFDSETPPPVETHGEQSLATADVVTLVGESRPTAFAPPATVSQSQQTNLQPFLPVLAAPAPRDYAALRVDYSDSILVDQTQPLAKYSVQPIPGIATTFTPSLWRLVLVELGEDSEEQNERTSPFRRASYQPTRLSNMQVPAVGHRVPISGDFDGDGTDELGFFLAGDWFIDMNHNERWDSDDVWIRLGNDRSTPITGDWNGDGKCDLGIFEGDSVSRPSVAVAESEFANARVHQVRKSSGENVPSLKIQAVDRVFQFGKATHQPVVGDWNGNGVATIGVFVNGIWQLDVDGNGHWNRLDERVEFGKSGDVAFVGDFDGDGKADLAILRNGILIVDSNGNRKIDSSDQRIAVKGGGDEMVVGDFDGDGRDEVKIATSTNLRRAS